MRYFILLTCAGMYVKYLKMKQRKEGKYLNDIVNIMRFFGCMSIPENLNSTCDSTSNF